ncbi:MAG: 4-hydroxy-tetrahydrodipicolinate reductase [Gammaproteobacteria bacterium]|nr:4-hydroxy-tetrahydrodipicolinate reductase [Gammaproteobacteria bacterium]
MNNSTRSSLRLALLGASGRMGREVLALLPGNSLFELSGAGCSSGSGLLNQPVDIIQPGLPALLFQADPAKVMQGAKVVIDFSLPGATQAHLSACREQGVAMVLCTTGHDASQLEHIRELSKSVPVLLAANTSLGIALLNRLVELAAGVLGEQFDTEIFEVHHRNKRDLPSGTALGLGRSVARGRGSNLDSLRQDRLPGSESLRGPGSVGFAALRGGDVAGEHSVMFAGEGERLELIHRVSKRATFAHGALKAAQWLAGQPPGLYEMSDVLGLK